LEDQLDIIIRGCVKNDRKYQEKLYKMFFPTMMSMCHRYTRDDDEAMSIVNDGFLRVFKKIDSYGHIGSFEGWVRKFIYHSISDYFRKKSKQLKFMVFEDYDASYNQEVLESLYEADIIKLIDAVPKASADVFILFAIQGYAHKEIAELKGISVGTSKWHVSEARKKLQDLLKKKNNKRYVI